MVQEVAFVWSLPVWEVLATSMVSGVLAGLTLWLSLRASRKTTALMLADAARLEALRGRDEDMRRELRARQTAVAALIDHLPEYFGPHSKHGRLPLSVRLPFEHLETENANMIPIWVDMVADVLRLRRRKATAFFDVWPDRGSSATARVEALLMQWSEDPNLAWRRIEAQCQYLRKVNQEAWKDSLEELRNLGTNRRQPDEPRGQQPAE